MADIQDSSKSDVSNQREMTKSRVEFSSVP
jgi:hypothetical protein